MADIMIRVDHVTMDFRMDVNRTTNLKEWVMNALQGKRKIEHFRALPWSAGKCWAWWAAMARGRAPSSR